MTAITYEAPWPVYALAWSRSAETTRRHSADDLDAAPSRKAIPEDARLAVGSFVEEYTNRIQVLGADTDDDGEARLVVLADALHPYPATKLSFQPESSTREDASSSALLEKRTREQRWSSADLPNTRASSVSSTSSVSSNSVGDISEFAHDVDDGYPDSELLASSADSLRIWEIQRSDALAGLDDDYNALSLQNVTRKASPPRPRFALREKCALAHSKSATSPPAPLTSFSWNAPSPNLIVTSSIDTTCTIWDLPTRSALTQLIAHDREVYDVDWCPGSADVFASVGADGSVRVFDLRNLEHSTIIYETTSQPTPPSSAHASMGASTYGSGGGVAPLLRIAFNPWDANYLATFHLESNTVQILDVRAPGSPILELRGHSGAVNSVAWGPPSQGLGRNGPSKGMIGTGGDDAQCLVYDLASATLRSASAQGRRSRNSHMGGGAASRSSPSTGGESGLRIGAEVPVLAYTAPSMVNNVTWLRSPLSARRRSQPKHHSFYRNLLHEWTDYATQTGMQGTGNADWLALCAGRSVKVLRV
ncbi:hypothetical protein MSPP1_002489 [Malassezia sp. CBS 17886]|nr:hypothetical protein MSPP1_002489 [Malassezia sp. CBS 17886]